MAVTISPEDIQAPPPTTPPTLEPWIIPRPGRPWTEDDLLALSDDPRRFELVQGDLLMMSPASPVQGRYAERLSRVLGAYVDQHGLGEVYVSEPAFRLRGEPDTIIRVPDVAFVRVEQIPPAEDEEGFWSIAPDLAVEIISPTEGASGIEGKVHDYLDAGTRLVWLVYPRKKRVQEYKATGQHRIYHEDESLDGGEVIPGFAYALRDLFRPSPRQRQAESQ